MKLTPEQQKMARSFAARLEQSRVDQGSALLKPQEAARKADPRPSEEIVRSERDVDLADVFGYGPSAPGWKEPC
jgi:hypothetical protein